jgi:uncharacterized protein (DUF1015 family)
MAVVKPFRAIRPVPEMAAEVAAPPYDVLDSEEARAMVQGNPRSFLRVSKPEVDLDPSINLHDPRVFRKARENFEAFVRDGILVQDPQARLYLYRLKMGDHVQTGLYACVSTADYENGTIKKHEHTRPDKEEDRLAHIHALNAQTGPVFLMFRDRDAAAVRALFEQAAAKKPEYRFVHQYDVEHTFWVVKDEAWIRSVQAAFAAGVPLYIADGHHRAAAAVKAAQERRGKNPGHTGREEYNFFPAVIFPDTEMQILNYNRVVNDLHGLSPDAFLKRIGESFGVSPSPDGKAFAPAERGTFGMRLGDRWFVLRAPESRLKSDDPIARLDVSILQDLLLDPVLGIRDPRTDKRIQFVGGIRGLGELERLVSAGAAVAFSLTPTGIDQLIAVADSGQVMPPKSTWFEPKLRSGLASHFLD